jgi:hypothetical protein
MGPPLRVNGFGFGPGRAMLDLDRIMGAIEEDPVACVVFERFMGRLWSCGCVSMSGSGAASLIPLTAGRSYLRDMVGLRPSIVCGTMGHPVAT